MNCTECGKLAVTKDGRHLCLKCLREAIKRDTPMIGCYPRPRTSEQAENVYETKHGRDG